MHFPRIGAYPEVSEYHHWSALTWKSRGQSHWSDPDRNPKSAARTDVTFFWYNASFCRAFNQGYTRGSNVFIHRHKNIDCVKRTSSVILILYTHLLNIPPFNGRRVVCLLRPMRTTLPKPVQGRYGLEQYTIDCEDKMSNLCELVYPEVADFAIDVVLLPAILVQGKEKASQNCSDIIEISDIDLQIYSKHDVTSCDPISSGQ